MSELLPPPWTADDTEKWLTRFPLPVDFRWDKSARQPGGAEVTTPDQPVLPEYRIKKGYGFWLRTTPYFPGLFEEIHDILLRAAEDQPLSTEWVVERLLERRRARGVQQVLTIEGPLHFDGSYASLDHLR